MKIVVYPHTLELGGSQLNAIELAAAVRDRGHDVVVHAEPGELLGRIEDLGLRFVPCTRSGPRPHPGVAWDLLRLARRDGVDVLHGYEWPPILEVEAAAAAPGGPACTGTIMSMSVAPFLPDLNPLVVGTRRIRDHEVARGRRRVHVVEPPVDLATNHPGVTGGTWERAHPVPAGTLRVVIVSRLSEQLKLEGILSAIRAVGDLADSIDIRLQIAGDGPARAQVERAAAAANGRRAHPVVELLGNLPDPRGAYDAADVTIGMGAPLSGRCPSPHRWSCRERKASSSCSPQRRCRCSWSRGGTAEVRPARRTAPAGSRTSSVNSRSTPTGATSSAGSPCRW